MAQSSGGRTISLIDSLADGTLVFGYGDTATNEGPIDLLGLDPDTSTWSVLYNDMPTEAIRTGRTIDGWLWVPSIDPSGTTEGTLLTNNPAGTWRLAEASVSGIGPAVHLFDVAGAGSTVYTCGVRKVSVAEGNAGAADYGAAIIRSTTNGGTTFTENLVYLGTGTDPGNHFAEFLDTDAGLVVNSADGLYHWTLTASTWVQGSGNITPPTSEWAQGWTGAHVGGLTYVCNGATVYQIA